MPPTSITARYARALLATAERLGADVRALLATAGVDASQLADPDGRIPLGAMEVLWAEAVRRTGDPTLGLRVGADLSPGRLGVLEHVLLASATLGEALERLIRYERLLVDGSRTTLVANGRTTVLAHGTVDPSAPCSPYAMESFLATAVTMGRWSTGIDFAPLAVRFRHPRPDDTSAHEQLFRAPLHFAAPDNALVLDARALDLPVRLADAGLAPLLERYAEQLMARLPPIVDGDTAVRVRQFVRGTMRGSYPRIAEAARTLALSERTLQRRLREAGTTYQALVDETRRELALAHLREPAVALAEIALLTGFAEPSAFHRAFRRWTGSSPSAYRTAAREPGHAGAGSPPPRDQSAAGD